MSGDLDDAAVRFDEPADRRECVAAPKLCFVVECKFNLTWAMSPRGVSPTRCMLQHADATSTRDIGAVLGIEHSTVRVTIVKALAKLRRRPELR